MKAYNEYMDNISVSDALHRRFITYAANTDRSHHSTIVRRYAAVFASLAAILLGILIVPQLLQKNAAPITGSSQNPGANVPAVTKSNAKGQNGAVYHNIDISRIIRQKYTAKVPATYFFQNWLMSMKKDSNIGSHWDNQQFTKEDIGSALNISVTNPVLPDGDYTTKQAVLMDDATDAIVAYQTAYYYFNKDTMEFQNGFSIFYFAEDYFNAEKIEEMQNVAEVNGKIHIDDFTPSTDVYGKVPHVRKLIYLKNGAGMAIEAEADAVITGDKIDQKKSLECYEQTDKQLIALMSTSVFQSTSAD